TRLLLEAGALDVGDAIALDGHDRALRQPVLAVEDAGVAEDRATHGWTLLRPRAGDEGTGRGARPRDLRVVGLYHAPAVGITGQKPERRPHLRRVARSRASKPVVGRVAPKATRRRGPVRPRAVSSSGRSESWDAMLTPVARRARTRRTSRPEAHARGSPAMSIQPEDLILISVDDHICEPADIFEGRVPAKYANDAPFVKEDEQGRQQWWYQGKPGRNLGLNAAAGK